MLLDDLALYLQTAGLGAATTSTGERTIFRGQLPDQPDAAIGLIEYGGMAPVRAMFPAIVYEQPRVQVLVRARTYDGARTKAESVFQALDGVGNTTLTSTSPRYGFIEALQSPFLLTRDANDRVVLALNLQIRKGLST